MKMNPIKAMKTKTKKNKRDNSNERNEGQETRTFTRDELREKVTDAMYSVQDCTQDFRSWEQCVYEGDRIADALFDEYTIV